MHQNSRALSAKDFHKPNAKKPSSGDHEPTEDVEVVRVDLRNARNTTQANCNPSRQ